MFGTPCFPRYRLGTQLDEIRTTTCAESVLLPAVRAADARTAVLADGFSCRTQIRQLGDREPVHLAELLVSGLREGSQLHPKTLPPRPG